MAFLDVSGCVELAVIDRADRPESRHLGAAVVVDADGTVIDSLGDPAALFYPRSAAKALQAFAMLDLGAPLTGAHLAIAMASHAGTPSHVALVDEILVAAGLERDALGCPEAWPGPPEAIRGVDGPARVTMTCSGKHAGFLCGAVHTGADPSTYLDRSNRVQQAVASTIEALAGESVASWGVDGCRAPTPVLSMTGFARATSRALAARPELLAVAQQTPWAIDDVGAPNAIVIAETGAFAKTGAEGVMVIALPTGETVVTKTLDGADRVGTPVALELLARAGLISRDSVTRMLSQVGNPALRIAF